MSAIFDNAKSVTLGHKLSLVQTSSQSGKRSAQRRGPYLYTFEVDVNDMYTSSDKYHAINSELRLANYGVNTLSVTMSNQPFLIERGSWAGAPKVKGGGQTGTTISMDGFPASTANVIRDGDFVQFPNDLKVYQAVGDRTSDASGNVILTLNTSLVKSPVDNAVLSVGKDVAFNLALIAFDDPVMSPRGVNDNIASWSSFEFEEVI
jgi:hypothetical protein